MAPSKFDNLPDGIAQSDFLRAIFSTLDDGCVVVDQHFDILAISESAKSMLMAKGDRDIDPANLLTLLPKNEHPAFQSLFEQSVYAADANTAATFRLSLDQGANNKRIVDASIAPVASPNGDIAAAIIRLEDVSGWQAAIESASLVSAELESVLSAIPDAMVVIGAQGRILAFSSAAENLFGYQEAEVVGQNVKILMPEPHAANHDQYIKSYVETGVKRIIGKGRTVDGLKKDGTIFPLELHVGDASIGDDHRFIGFIHDISERRKRQNELQELQLELEHASRVSAIGSLAGILAHELNQPLTAIANYMSAGRDILRDRGVGDDPLEFALDEASREAVRAGKIIQRLREFVIKDEMNKERISVAELLEESCTLGLVGAPSRGILIRKSIDGGLGYIIADRIQMQQVILNLLRNAIDAMEGTKTKELTLGAHRIKKGWLEISVTDTGKGIASEVAEHLFKSFVTDKAKGMGLGLSICRSIIDAHDGTIWAEPNSCGGTIFKINLRSEYTEVEDAN